MYAVYKSQLKVDVLQSSAHFFLEYLRVIFLRLFMEIVENNCDNDSKYSNTYIHTIVVFTT